MVTGFIPLEAGKRKMHANKTWMFTVSVANNVLSTLYLFSGDVLQSSRWKNTIEVSNVRLITISGQLKTSNRF